MPETCIICKEPIKMSGEESWGATAIENTIPVKIRHWHFDCYYPKVVEDEE